MVYFLVVFMAAMAAGFFSGYGQKRRPSGVNGKSATPARAAQDGSWATPAIGKGGSKKNPSKFRPEKSSPVARVPHVRHEVTLNEGNTISGVIFTKSRTSRPSPDGGEFDHFRVVLGLADGDTAIVWGEDLQRALADFDLGDWVKISCVGVTPVKINGGNTVAYKRLYQAQAKAKS